MKEKIRHYLNEDANGFIYVSKQPMNQDRYSTPAILRCVSTKSKRITKKGVFAGAICVTVTGDILRVVSVKFRKGYSRSYIREGEIRKSSRVKNILQNERETN